MPDFDTKHEEKLYHALKKLGLNVRSQVYDGFKNIDITIPKYRINIEVDGGQHTFNPRQALADLQREYHSFKKGWFTLHIPNALIDYDLEQVARIIRGFCYEIDKDEDPSGVYYEEDEF